MPATLYRIGLPVDDLAAADAFWSALLGLEVDDRIPNRHYLQTDGALLVIIDTVEHDRVHGLDPEPFRPNREILYFAVADLENTYERAQALHMPSLGDDEVGDGIATRPWGERSFYGRDPAGNPICFVDETTLYTGK